jgi:uncharacterized protein YegP (UPF0339 family)
MKRACYEIFQGHQEIDEGWYWRLVGANGEKMALSEAYTTQSDAKRGAGDAKRASILAKIETVEP